MTEASRITGVVAGAVALFAFPAWALFDHLVTTDRGGEFTLIRLVSTVPIAFLWGLLFAPFGRRRPELITLGILLVIEVAIAIMIARVGEQHAAYALGFSLALYGATFLVIWPALYSALLAVLSLLALAIAMATVGEGLGSAEVATVGFYAGTAAIISVAGQILRERQAWREFQTRLELESEQLRTSELVSELDQLSREDSLTGLTNRRGWDEALSREFSRADRDGRTFSVLLCDVDGLKGINDTLGHAVGDVVIRKVAEVISGRMRRADVGARIGGDEFALLAVGTGEFGAVGLAEELRATIEAEQPAVEALSPVTVSIGVAEWEGPEDAPSSLMMRADRRLYVAKREHNAVHAEGSADQVG